jgi:hypothetical protein
MYKLLIVLLTLLFFAACSDKEPAVAGLKKDKTVEVTFETQRLGDTAVLLLTHQNVYIKGNLVKAQIKRDTLPALGDSIQNITEDGDENEKVARLPKEYEFFVTVK